MDPQQFHIHQLETPMEQDARALSRISRASKAHWGYPEEWLNLWRADLEVSTDYLRQHHTFVIRLHTDQSFIGFCILSEEGSHLLWVEHLWVLPEYIGRGLGSALLQTALTACIRSEHQAVKVIADPNAAPFYAAKGFVTVDEHPSQPGDRKLPVMEKRLGE